MSHRGRTVTMLAACTLVGCSFGTFQTAHTQPAGTLSVTPGVAYAFNRIDDEGGRGLATNLGAQLGARLGITERVDLGVGSFLLSGAKGDVKVNLLDPRSRFALSPRLGAGYRFGRSVSMLEGGAIASYRLDWLEPYVGLSFTNQWIEPQRPQGELPSTVVGRSGTGDGLLQASLGVELILSRRIGLIAEYGGWFPLHDDPGDFYRFLPTNIAGIALRFGRLRL